MSLVYCVYPHGTTDRSTIDNDTKGLLNLDPLAHMPFSLLGLWSGNLDVSCSSQYTHRLETRLTKHFLLTLVTQLHVSGALYDEREE